METVNVEVPPPQITQGKYRLTPIIPDATNTEQTTTIHATTGAMAAALHTRPGNYEPPWKPVPTLHRIAYNWERH